MTKCREVFRVFQQHDDFIKNAKCAYYDLQSILYSLDDLKIKKVCISHFIWLL